jgi:DHA2 family multidrug resistance protein
MGCVAVFTVSSVLCGMAPSLGALIFFRVLQGLGGGGMAPSEQAILADTFPPWKRAQAFALYGVAVIVAPTVGPTLGGWITDNYSWHWIFFINGPIGVASLILVQWLVVEPEALERERRARLAKGIKVDWGRNDPIVNIRLLLDRQFGTAFVVMLTVGVVLYGSTQFMPQMLQESFQYTALISGLALMPGGVAMLLMMPIAGQLSNRVQPRYLMAIGMACIALSMWHTTSIDSETSFGWFAWMRIFQMVLLPFLFIPINTVAYSELRPQDTAQASSLVNVARNLGGSIGISMANTMLAQREQFHQARLAEHISPSSLSYQQWSGRITQYFVGQGDNLLQAKQHALGWIGQTVTSQSMLLSYLDVFWSAAIFAALMIPVTLSLKAVDLSRGGPAAH